MKKLVACWLLVITSSIAFGQGNSISGTVTDDQGKPVPFAFVKDAEQSYATFSNADGAFTLAANPSSRLLISGNNYQTSVVKVDNPQDVKIVLKPGTSAGGTLGKEKSDSFVVHEEQGISRMARPLAHFGTQQEELHGSPYFFNEWVHGYAISPKDSIIENDRYLFNYEKISGQLLYTDGGETMKAADKDLVKAFILFDNNGQRVAFEDVPSIDSKHYLQVLAAGKTYKIYKQLGTVFIKADFQTNGITSSGNNYDSYADQSTYYVVKQPNGQPQKISLKRKSIKSAFSADAAKAASFMDAHGSDEVDDNYLIALGAFMNNQAP